MNYTNLNTKELLHYASLDAKTDLEAELVKRLRQEIYDERETNILTTGMCQKLFALPVV